MRLLRLATQQFRNLGFLELDLAAARHFFLGANGQGKTNLLEAIGFLSLLRSFRVNDRSSLIEWGKPEALLHYTVEQEHRGETTVRLRLHGTRLEASIDGTQVARMSDAIGHFPTVCFSSQDIQLLRGGPSLRRRFVDTTLASGDPRYLEALRGFHEALDRRNALLKEGQSADDILEAFELGLARHAAVLIAVRKRETTRLREFLQQSCGRYAPEAEQPDLLYLPDLDLEDSSALRDYWRNQRPRDRQWKSTGRGPQRDDFQLAMHGREARDAASEGQQRGLVLALRFAQAAWLEEKTRLKPALLLDDILGELDPRRKELFWHSLDPRAQLFATGTVWPEGGGGWTGWAVQSGQVTRTSL